MAVGPPYFVRLRFRPNERVALARSLAVIAQDQCANEVSRNGGVSGSERVLL